MLILPTDPVVRVASELRHQDCLANDGDDDDAATQKPQTNSSEYLTYKNEANISDSLKHISKDYDDLHCTAMVTSTGKLYIGQYDGVNRGKLRQVNNTRDRSQI